MDINKVEETVNSIIVDKLCVNPSEVVKDASLMRDLGADSLDLNELIFELEREFDISLSDTNPNSLITVGDVVRFISEKTTAA